MTENKNPRLTGVLEADERTRTLDLLHGKYTERVPRGSETAWLSRFRFPLVPAVSQDFR
jgi:hypothetical protein